MVSTRRPISPQAAARYLERWAIARKRLDEELRATSMEAKLRQLANLMQSAREMGWSQSLDEEDDSHTESARSNSPRCQWTKACTSVWLIITTRFAKSESRPSFAGFVGPPWLASSHGCSGCRSSQSR